jgi:hypothetical protein
MRPPTDPGSFLGIGLDLYPHRRVNQPGHFDEGRGRTDRSKALPESVRDRLEVLDAGDEDPEPHDRFPATAQRRERGLDIVERPDGLRIRVVRSDHRAVGCGRGGAGDVDAGTDPDRPAVPDLRLPRRAA